MEQPTSTYQADAPYILVTYAPADSEQVLPEMNWLHQQEFNVRLDAVAQTETKWSPELVDAVNNATLILCFISANTKNSSGIQKIIDSAATNSTPLLRIYLQDAEMPQSSAEVVSIFKYDLSEDEFREQMISALITQAANTRIQPISTPAMPDMSEMGPPNLLQHGMVALAILILGMLVYLYLSP